MDIVSFPLGPLETNCYLAASDGRAVALDVGGDPAPVLAHMRAHGLTLEAICLTHLHCDHLYGVAALMHETGVRALAGAEDARLMDLDLGRGGLMGLPMVDPFVWEPVAPGEITLLGQSCRVLATPGHSPGSRSYYFPEAGAVFVGDLLFYRSIGRTDFVGGDYDVLLGAVVSQIFSLPDKTLVYPGHGPATTVGDEKRHNPFFSEFAR
ncbi:MAG: MBL fold metallo-hydrolase [Acidobacteriota bacterium]